MKFSKILAFSAMTMVTPSCDGALDSGQETTMNQPRSHTIRIQNDLDGVKSISKYVREKYGTSPDKHRIVGQTVKQCYANNKNIAITEVKLNAAEILAEFQEVIIYTNEKNDVIGYGAIPSKGVDLHVNVDGDEVFQSSFTNAVPTPTVSMASVSTESAAAVSESISAEPAQPAVVYTPSVPKKKQSNTSVVASAPSVSSRDLATGVDVPYISATEYDSTKIPFISTITKITPEGKKMDFLTQDGLTSLLNDVTSGTVYLISFGGTWCAPCRELSIHYDNRPFVKGFGLEKHNIDAQDKELITFFESELSVQFSGAVPETFEIRDGKVTKILDRSIVLKYITNYNIMMKGQKVRK